MYFYVLVSTHTSISEFHTIKKVKVVDMQYTMKESFFFDNE